MNGGEIRGGRPPVGTGAVAAAFLSVIRHSLMA